MTALSTSLISFGDYIFPFGAWVKERQTPHVIETTPMLGIDGVIAPAGVDDAHTVTIATEIGGGGDFDPASTLDDIIYINSPDQLNNALNNLFAQLEQGYAALTLGQTPARTINAQYRKFAIEYLEGSGRRHATVGLDFLCPDPRWLAVTPQTLTSDGNATNNGNMLSYPLVTYTQTGSDASDPVTLIVYPGGPDTGPYVELALNLTLLEGDVLVINCDPRKRAQGIIYTPNGDPPESGLYLLGTTGCINTVGNDATFPYLLPGSNAVQFGGANSISFVWQDAYAL